SYEIRWFSSIAMQVGFALENAKLIETNALANEINKGIYLPQQEDLRQVIIELSQDSQMIFKAFWTKGLNLSNYLAVCRKQIKEILDTAKVMKTTAEEIEKQVQRNYELLEEERINIKSTLESISALEEAVKNTETIELDPQIVETQLLTGEIEKINEIIEIIKARSQEISTWARSLQTNKQKLDRIFTVNMQIGRLMGNITQTATSQTEASKEVEKNIVSADRIVEHILEKSQFFAKWFAQLTTFAQNSTQKIMFWENLKSFVASFHKLIASSIQQS
ncbi:MAG: hypothetical protein WBA41_29240, partial [Rivularia sp. (in: cyanobacteria)]